MAQCIGTLEGTHRRFASLFFSHYTQFLLIYRGCTMIDCCCGSGEFMGGGDQARALGERSDSVPLFPSGGRHLVA
jgi:hypothetical protein